MPRWSDDGEEETSDANNDQDPEDELLEDAPADENKEDDEILEKADDSFHYVVECEDSM